MFDLIRSNSDMRKWVSNLQNSNYSTVCDFDLNIFFNMAVALDKLAK